LSRIPSKPLEYTKGERIGRGFSAEVFAWGEDRVLKLFLPEYAYVAAIEAPRAAAVADSGASAPTFHGEVTVDARPGLVFERVDGPLLVSRLREPGRRAEVGRRLAEVHLGLHLHTSAALRSLRETLLERSTGWDEDVRTVLRAHVEALLEGNAIFHGDFHPGNVIESERGPVVIDWSHASLAHPAVDVARAEICMRYQGVSAELPEERALAQRSARDEIVDAYLGAYVAGSPDVTHEAIRAQLPHFAGALAIAQPANFEAARLRRLAGLVSA